MSTSFIVSFFPGHHWYQFQFHSCYYPFSFCKIIRNTNTTTNKNSRKFQNSWHYPFLAKKRSPLIAHNITQKMKFSIKDFFSNCEQICRKLRIWPHLQIYLVHFWTLCPKFSLRYDWLVSNKRIYICFSYQRAAWHTV